MPKTGALSRGPEGFAWNADFDVCPAMLSNRIIPKGSRPPQSLLVFASEWNARRLLQRHRRVKGAGDARDGLPIGWQ
ncbi:MAG: hypothetical protein P8J66_01965 [Verrucomicrobiota bacterium]|nr:hypothetical protein [Verrucomicrobiota bacterium]